MRTATALTPGAEDLAAALRDLVEAAVTTTASAETVRAVAAAVRQAQALLGDERRQGPWVPDQHDPQPSPYNTVLGVGNPFAAPVVLTSKTADGVLGEVTFGTAYEGAPGLVHGGVLSMVMDQLFGEAGVAAKVAGMTVGLEIRYAAPTPVHVPLQLEARVTDAGYRKVLMAGNIKAGDVTTVTATATFFRLTEAHARRIFPHMVRE